VSAAVGGPEGRESIPRSAAFAFAMRVVGALFTGALTLFLVRYLGADDYGVYALALSVAGLLLLPADFGISRSSARFIAERLGDQSQVAAVLRQALTLKVLGAGFVAVVLIATAGPIANAYDVPDLEWPLRVVALAVFAQSLLMLSMASFEAIGRNALGFRVAFSESAVETSTTLVLVLAGAGVTGAVTGRAAGYAVAALLGLLLLGRAIGRSGLRAPGRSPLSMRRIAGYAGALFVIDASFAAFREIDILIIGAVLDAEAAGQFSAPMQILTFAEYLGLALAAGVAPRLARGATQQPNAEALQGALRLLLILQFLLVAPFVVWAAPITDLLLGPGYEESAEVFRGLGPYILMVGPGPLLALAVNYIGEARRRVPLALAALGINAVIDAILIPEIGIVGGAIGTNVAFFIFVTGHLLISRQVIGLRLRPLAGTLARTALAAGAMAAVLFAFGTSSLSAVQAVAGAVLGLAAYGGVILLTREFTRAELIDGLALIGSRWRRN
jgi:O-antigen/teichoic acid export membrane protein